MKKLAMLILLAFGLYGCGDPPPAISSAEFETRVMEECMKKLSISPEGAMWDTSLQGWRSKVEYFERYYAYEASRHPTDGRWAKAVERLEVIDRDVSRCNADLVFRTELLAKMQKEAVDREKRDREQVKKDDRYNTALKKCGNWRTEAEYRAVLRCVRSYGFQTVDPDGDYLKTGEASKASRPERELATGEQRRGTPPRGSGLSSSDVGRIVSSCDAKIAEKTKEFRFKLSERDAAYLSVMCFHGELDRGVKSLLRRKAAGNDD